MSLVMEVLRRFDERGVAYCHWKSNDHLEAALSADTDLDVLVDPAGIDAVYAVFAELACRRGRVANARNDVGLEDFLGVDDESGRMVHFHVHYRIPGGERHNKRFRLPWERTVLETRVRDESGVWVTAPDVEVVLLLTRYALKLRGRDIARGAHGPDAELAFLMDRTDHDAVLATTRRLLGDRAVPVVADVLAAGPSTSALYRLRRIVLRELGSQASSRGPAAFTRRMNREAAWAMRGISRKVAPRPVLKGRGGTGGGLLVAFVGCDGSGKSTMVGETRAFLAPKLDVYPMYLGSGDGSSSLLRKPMKIVRDMVFGPSRNKGTIARKAEAGAAHPGAMSAAKAIWAVSLAAEKHRKLHQAMKARTRGMVVICDRWPQMQFAGELDGPRLTHWAGGRGWQRRLAAYELRPYELARRFPPDLVIRLDVDLDTASARRPEDGREYLEHRIALVRALTFDGSLFGAVDVDATQPPDKVLTAILRAIWSRLQFVGTVVEFCGLPGAGKSTIAGALVASLRLQGVPTTEVMAPLGPAATRAERMRRKTVVIARGMTHAGGVALAGNVGFRSGQQAGRDRVARPANLLVVRDAVRRAKHRNGVHVLDQGPVQEWWSAALRADDTRVLRWAATDPSPRADLVVRVDAPVDLLARRLAGRGERQSRLEGVTGEELVAELTRGEWLLDALCDELVHSPGTRRSALIRVDGYGSGAVVAVGEALRRLGGADVWGGDA